MAASTSLVGNGLFFDSAGSRLYGFYEPPKGRPRDVGVLFVHGAFEERQDAHLVTRDAAERLAAMGFPTLRFDLFGHGDSEGEYADATFDAWTQNAVDAAAQLAHQSNCKRVALVGLRVGGLVAAAAAARITSPAVEKLVLWQPVLEGRAYVMDVLRAFLAAEMMVHRHATTTREAIVAKLRAGESVNVYGYPLSSSLFESLARVDLAALLEHVTSPVLCVDVTRAPNAPPGAEIARVAARFAPRVQCTAAHEAQPLHAEGKLFLNRADQVFAATSRFLGDAT